MKNDMISNRSVMVGTMNTLPTLRITRFSILANGSLLDLTRVRLTIFLFRMNALTLVEVYVRVVVRMVMSVMTARVRVWQVTSTGLFL